MTKIHEANMRSTSLGEFKEFPDPVKVGDALRTIRQCTGTTLEYLQVKTRIPYKRLVEIEKGINPLPEEVQVIHAILAKRKSKK